jgi:archaellum component FlaF (FlaF/FlaG flagellin family)
MKPISILNGAMVLLCSVMICPAQSLTSQSVQAALPAATPYAITTQDANSRIWQRTTYDAGPSGTVMTNVHSYTEMASGLNHKVNGQWVASSEYISILPNGTAVATNGQHQAYFPGDIYEGQIKLVTPDGLQLNSRPLALVYFDGTNTEVIAELTNSTGVVVGNNQVVYPSAFTSFEVDLRYTYTKGGFEQDIILRQQPPTPGSLGLNPDTARLQVLTEFFSPPQPTIQSTTLPAQAGISLVDQNLGFGSMQMVPGKAFLMGTNATDAGAMVSKSWLTVEGRQILMEEVPVDAILAGLAALPMTAMNSNSGKHSHTASRQLKLPPKRLAVNQTSKTMLLAKADLPAEGFLLDYQTINSSLTNYTFRGDTTYYISGLVNLYGTSTFEGGAVIKYTNRAALQIAVTTTPVWNSAPYRPIIFTAKDDNSVGDAISGSTGTPTGYYASSALNFTTANHNNYPVFSNFRIAYASNGISSASSSGSGNPTIRDGQFVNCQYACGFAGSFCYVYNALFANVGTNFTFLNVGSLDMANVTFANVGTIIAPGAVAPADAYTMENCVLANVTSLGGYTLGTPPTGNNNGFYSAPTFGTGTTISVNPFQTVGAGSYYLTNGCGFQNAGTTSIDATLLADIKTKTTYPPILYSNVTVAVNTTLSPQAQRDIDTPDLGYHYDPIDYLVDQFTVTNALLTLTNGVAIANYNDTGIWLEDGSSITSIGSPLYPNWIVRYSSAQEEPVSLLGLSGSGPSSGLPLNPYHQTVAPNGQFRFTKFACPAGGGDHIYHSQPNWSYGNLLVQDCEFWSGANLFGGNTNTVATLKNNLFARSTFSAIPYTSTAFSYLYVTNNLFWGASAVTFGQALKAVASTNWCVFNNDFDSCTNIGNLTVSITNGYNAYLNSTGYVYPTNATDIFSTSALAYQTGPLGNFYQPTTSPLINVGSTNANLLGLYHYTTMTSELKETNSIVDIGYHYVATDQYANPIDTDGDGLPDYLEDANGNGLVDNGETSWTNYNSLNGLVSPNGLVVFTPLK